MNCRTFILVAGMTAAGIAQAGQTGISLSPISTYASGIFDEGAAEIVTYDKGAQRLFVSKPPHDHQCL